MALFVQKSFVTLLAKPSVSEPQANVTTTEEAEVAAAAAPAVGNTSVNATATNEAVVSPAAESRLLDNFTIPDTSEDFELWLSDPMMEDLSDCQQQQPPSRTPPPHVSPDAMALAAQKHMREMENMKRKHEEEFRKQQEEMNKLKAKLEEDKKNSERMLKKNERMLKAMKNDQRDMKKDLKDKQEADKEANRSNAMESATAVAKDHRHKKAPSKVLHKLPFNLTWTHNSVCPGCTLNDLLTLLLTYFVPSLATKLHRMLTLET